MNEYEIAGIIGCGLVAAWLLGLIISRFGAWCWAWVDESQVRSKDWWFEQTIERMMPVLPSPEEFGWKRAPHGSYWRYYKGPSYSRKTAHTDSIQGFANTETQDPSGYVATLLAVLLFSPTAVVIAFAFYPIAIAVVLAYTIAHLARYSRRHKKAFDEHTKDKEAHK